MRFIYGVIYGLLAALSVPWVVAHGGPVGSVIFGMALWIGCLFLGWERDPSL